MRHLLQSLTLLARRQRLPVPLAFLRCRSLKLDCYLVTAADAEFLNRAPGANVVNEAIGVKQDIDFILEGWEYKPGMVQARLVQAAGGRQVIQMRVDLG